MFVGVDIGGTRVRAAMAGDPATISVATPSRLDELPAVVTDVIARLGEEPEAIGIACAGLVDHARGVVRWMPHASGRDVPMGETLAATFGVPVWVDNDASAAAMAEAVTGAGVGHRMVLTLTVGTGIGAGLVVDGVVERGRGHLGEVGHLRLAASPECACGRIGCWEELASGRALDRAASIIEPGADGARLVELARAGDDAATAAIAGVARWLAIGIENLVLTVDPDIVILGGIAPVIGSVLFEPLLDHVATQRGGLAVSGMPPIVLAAHGERAGLEGAIMGAMESSA